jgi:SAM-dependent methyltransferase
MSADAAYRLACEGTALLWRGDFQNARQMLLAMARRVDEKTRKAQKPRKPPVKAKLQKPGKPQETPSRAVAAATTSTSMQAKPDTTAAATPPTEAFHLHRLAQSQRARTLGMLLLPLAGDYTVPLQRAPDLQRACVEAYGPPGGDAVAGDSVVSMRELLGLIGAHEWRKKGVDVPTLNDRIHPHYGVFAPVRGEYVGLVADALELLKSRTKSLPLAFDIGTGTGVLAAVMAKHSVKRIVAIDMDPRALACASDNLRRLKLSAQVQVVQADLFPEGPEGKNRAPLIVCNPPWIPARPSSPIESAIYDPESRMLRGFIKGLAAHLDPGGEGWLILSDIAEHLGLRSRAELLGYFEQGGLVVIDRIDVRSSHPRVSDTTDPLHVARAAEVTSLWRLGVAE